jgi:chromosome segregation ATPase
MSEDLTKKLPKSDSERLDLILTTTQNLGGRFDHLEARLENLEKKVEERLYDTRPIWHKVVADIAQLQTGQDSLAANVGDLQSGYHDLRSLIFDLRTKVRDVSRDQIVINDAVRRLHLDFHILDERLHSLLMNRNQQNSST